MTDDPLTAARRVYAEQGAGMSLSAVAVRAGVSRATIYKRLGSKPEILARLAREDGRPEGATDIDGRVMDALLETVTEHGFRAATIDQIARAAGVGAATIYRRYGDKDGLIRSFIKTRAPVQQMQDLPREKGSPRQKLETMTRFLLEFMQENRAFVRLVHTGTLEERTYLRGLRDASQSGFVRITAFFQSQQDAGALVGDIAAQDLATNYFGLLFAHSVLAEGRQPLDADRSCELIMRMFDPLFTGKAR